MNFRTENGLILNEPWEVFERKRGSSKLSTCAQFVHVL